MSKREYDWMSSITTVEIVEAPPTFPQGNRALSAEMAAWDKSNTQQRHQSSIITSFTPGTIEKTYEKPPMKVSWIPDDVPVTRENLLNYLTVTEEDRMRIWSIDQREPDWHKQRAGRITGSRVGSAAGHNRYASPDKLIREWLYVPVVDNAAMKWGRDHEDPARDVYKSLRTNQFSSRKATIEFDPQPSYLPDDYKSIDNVVPVDPNEVSSDPFQIRVDVRGLIVHPTINWFGYSPDGEVFETDDKGLLEIKCPRKMYDEIAWFYYDQIQFGMFNLGVKWCDFVVWTREATTLKRYAFNEDYWNHELYPKLETFYHDKFIPEAIVAIEKERAWDPKEAK